MEIETAKKELKNYRRIYNEIQAKRERHAELKRQLYTLRINRSGERVLSSPKPSDTLETLIDKMTALEEKIAEGILELSAEAERISGRINSLDYPFCEVLVRRYVKLQRWEKIAVEMNYSYRYTKDLHKKAVIKYCRF